MLAGMAQLYPGVCSEGILYPHTRYPRRLVSLYSVGINSVSFNSKGFPRTSASGRAEVDTRVFSFCS